MARPWYPGKNVERFLDRRRDEEEKPAEKPETGKEDYFLKFNKREIFKNLIAAEGHLRNVAGQDENIEAGMMNCVAKHMLDSEGHSDEAISHSAVVEGQEASDNFSTLSRQMEGFTTKLQNEGMTPFDGIKEVRKIRRFFESFNPEFDIGKCKACEPIERLMKKALEQQEICESEQG